MAKTDNTKQIIYDFKGVFIDTNDKGETVLTHEEFDAPIKLSDIESQFLGQLIDLKIGGAVKVSSELFNEGDE